MPRPPKHPKHSGHADDEFLHAVELPPLLPEGTYNARVVSLDQEAWLHAKPVVEVWWEIVMPEQHAGARLPSRMNRPKSGPHPTGSDVAKWMRLVAEYEHSTPTKLKVSALKRYLYEVEVKTVKLNGDRRLKPCRDWSSRVAEITGIVQRLGTRTSEQPPHTQKHEEAGA